MTRRQTRLGTTWPGSASCPSLAWSKRPGCILLILSSCRSGDRVRVAGRCHRRAWMDSIPPWNAENRRSTAKENPMKQYLLSVQSVEGSAPRPPEAMQKAYQDVAAFNADLQAAGAWVFACGLHPPSAATTVRVQDGEVLMTGAPSRCNGGRQPRSAWAPRASWRTETSASRSRRTSSLITFGPSIAPQLKRSTAIRFSSGQVWTLRCDSARMRTRVIAPLGKMTWLASSTLPWPAWTAAVAYAVSWLTSATGESGVRAASSTYSTFGGCVCGCHGPACALGAPLPGMMWEDTLLAAGGTGPAAAARRA